MRSIHTWRHQPLVTFGASAGAKGSDSAKQRGIEYHRRFYRLLKLHADINLGPEWQVFVEPWFKCRETQALRSPDAALVCRSEGRALVIEAKMNWKDGRDTKLLDEYLPIVASAFNLNIVKPLLVTQNLRGYKHPPLLGLGEMNKAWDWMPEKPTPLMLVL